MGNETTDAAGRTDGSTASAPVCFIVDGEPSIRNFLSLVLHGAGLESEAFADAASFRQALDRRTPDLVFLDVGLQSADAIETVADLGQRSYRGFVQLMSSRGAAVMEHVRSAGLQHGLEMPPVLKKPFDTPAVIAILQTLKLGHTESRAARIELAEAISNGWIEFWYQPKIDLRRKQLAGVEAFARCRHPELGILLPAAFVTGAGEAELTTLSELALASVLSGSERLARLGINMPFAVNIPVNVLVKLSIPDLVQQHRTQLDQWAGLIIDVTEEQIVTDLTLANELTKQLAHVNVKLAIDNFGRGYSSLARLKTLPFAELKLDPTFVADCGTDRINAPLCKTVIDLAHNFGSLAVAIGIEKASDALALTSMGCDIGQGFLLGQPMPEERFISLLRQRAAGQGRTLAATG
jgi:EAL domain-containing protein (putative c-di-GMP-specific phosphodiesterase class I)/CheY-like chemotaxis protein